MKRLGNLYEKIISLENLRLADEKARRGKANTYGVRFHDRNREANIIALHEMLRTKSFRNRNMRRLPYSSQRNVRFSDCLIIPTASCTMP